MEIGMRERNPEKAIEEFRNIFGEKGEWFLQIVKEVVKFRKDGQRITDILVREGGSPLLAVLKNFFPLEGLEKIKVERDDIRAFVETILKSVMRGKEYEDFCRHKLKSIDFSFSIYGLGVFRVNYSADTNGDTLNIRVLDFMIPEFDEVLLPKIYVDYLKKRLILKKRLVLEGKETFASMVNGGGLIIHAGETGSGKTTTIASEIKFIADNTNGIVITYENPIEYRFLPFLYPRVRQLEIGRHIYLEDIHSHFLRNSPSVGMIGEMRTKDEFIKVLDLASRGHLVITTMHSRNVVEAVFTYLNMITPEMKEFFFGVVRAIVCHKLMVNKRCEIVPFYEVLFFEPPVRSFFLKEKDLNYQKISNYFYKEQKGSLVKEGYFYPFEQSVRDRVKERFIEGEDEKNYAMSIILGVQEQKKF